MVFEAFRHELSTIIRSDDGLKLYYRKLLVCFFFLKTVFDSDY